MVKKGAIHRSIYRNQYFALFHVSFHSLWIMVQHSLNLNCLAFKLRRGKGSTFWGQTKVLVKSVRKNSCDISSGLLLCAEGFGSKQVIDSNFECKLLGRREDWKNRKMEYSCHVRASTFAFLALIDHIDNSMVPVLFHSSLNIDHCFFFHFINPVGETAEKSCWWRCSHDPHEYSDG